MSPPATRTATFLFTDIEGSTRLWEKHRETMAVALGAHDAILRTVVEQADGTVVKTTGDGLLAAFERAESAIAAALAGQIALEAHKWPATGPLRVRMAVHSGSAEVRDGDYFGPALNRVARLLAIGHGGQVLVSGATAILVADDLPPGSELIDRGEHQLRDLDRPEHVYQLTAPDLHREFPQLRSLAAHASNLPNQLTSFVGRERELEALREHLARNRIVTLVGVGGTGKTRLMLEAARGLVDRYRDGVWLVELAPISDPGLVVHEVARVIGIQQEPGQDAVDTMVDFARSKELLLLLDNCEHVIAGAAGLAQVLLAACPSLTVLASSREPLGVEGEAVFAVPPLAMPVAIGAGDGYPAIEAGQLEEVARAEAVRLFVERARALLPSFMVGPGNVAAVVEICQRLDGIPLALELAAARVNVLSVQEIAQGLGDRFRLLTGGRRTAVPRQQTLQALIDWSWDLLSEADQRLLRRLSVFSGGWTLEAAADVTQTVAQDAGDAPLATLDGLSRLVDRSLVVVQHADSTRYRMLETIRQYARERLVASDEVALLRNRHLLHFLAMAQQAYVALRGADMIFWLRRLDAESDNLRAGLDWSFEADTEQALRLTVALMPYWSSRSYESEVLGRARAAADLAELLLVRSGEDNRDVALLASRVLAGACLAQATWGDAAAVKGWASRAVELARTTNDDVALAEALTAQVMVTVFSGKEQAGLDLLLAEAIGLSEQAADSWREAMCLGTAAMVQMMHGDIAGGEASIARSTEAAARSRNPWVIAYTAVARGNLSDYAGRLADARHWFATAIAAYEQMGDRRFVLVARSDLAHALRHGGALEEADALYRETLRDWQYAGNRGAVANQLECLAYFAIAQMGAVRAARLLGAAESLRDLAVSPMMAMERTEYDAAVEQLREQLDEVALKAAWAEGAEMTADEAVAFALTR